jgi:tetratricopeptide (TPR) repeat protein
VKDTRDPVEQAVVLLNVAATLRALSEFDKAREELSTVRSLIESSDDSSIEVSLDHRLLQLQVSLDFEDADICGYEGKLEEALAKFDFLVEKYAQALREPELRQSYEMIQARRGFIFADLGRCREALPVLKEAESFEERKAEIYFYLGHCYLTDREYEKAAEKLVHALRLGLPDSLMYRAHCELGSHITG